MRGIVGRAFSGMNVEKKLVHNVREEDTESEASAENRRREETLSCKIYGGTSTSQGVGHTRDLGTDVRFVSPYIIGFVKLFVSALVELQPEISLLQVPFLLSYTTVSIPSSSNLTASSTAVVRQNPYIR